MARTPKSKQRDIDALNTASNMLTNLMNRLRTNKKYGGKSKLRYQRDVMGLADIVDRIERDIHRKKR